MSANRPPGWASDNERAKTHLSRLGVNPATIARLEGYADADDMGLRGFVRFILSDYAPPVEIEEEAS